MRSILYCYRPNSVVCRSVILVSSAKTAEPIEMPLGCELEWAQGIVLDEGPELPHEKGHQRRI